MNRLLRERNSLSKNMFLLLLEALLSYGTKSIWQISGFCTTRSAYQTVILCCCMWMTKTSDEDFVYTFGFIWSSSINMMGKWAILLHSFPLFSSQCCSFNKGDYSSILSEAAHPLWITCTWAQGRKWLWHHSSANPLLSENFFRYIYQKINVQININVIELKCVEHNTTTHYLTIKH